MTCRSFEVTDCDGTAIELASGDVVINYFIQNKGDTGATGPIGPTGLTGATGANGVDGASGTNGAKGETGLQGLTGIQGIQGTQGLKGDKGDTGSQGLKGDTGLAGTNGNTILTTTGTPSSGLGNNGDYTIDQTAQLIYYKSGGAWNAGTSIKGVKGDTGATGANGTNGTNGTNGATGATGAVGATGLTGATGNSLARPTTTLTSASGVVTIDLSLGKEVYFLTLSENVTSWSFTNLPASGFTAEIRVRVTQNGSTAYTCVSPATSGLSAGGAWVNSLTLGAIESLGIAIDSSGNRTLFASGVYA